MVTSWLVGLGQASRGSGAFRSCVGGAFGRCESFGFTPTDAYCLVSTCPDFRINVYQMCNIAQLSYVAGAEIPRKYLP